MTDRVHTGRYTYEDMTSRYGGKALHIHKMLRNEKGISVGEETWEFDWRDAYELQRFLNEYVLPHEEGK